MTVLRMGEYHLWRWRVQSEPLGVEQKGMTDLDDMNFMRMNNTILFLSPCPLEAHHIPIENITSALATNSDPTPPVDNSDCS